jgi:hypothetical protein
MRPVDPDALDDDEDLRLYVAAFRRVEEPSAEARAATWKAIERETEPPRRRAVWIAAAIAAAAVLWIVLRTDAVALSWIGEDEPAAHGDQAEYVPLDAEEEYSAKHRGPRPSTRAHAVEEAPMPVEPVAEIEAPEIEAPAPAPAPAPSKPRPKIDRTRTLADETALFAEIQQALVDGRPAHALQAVARHEREYPRGAFRLERIVAKAQALCAVGRGKSARKLKADFLAKHGSSHLAPRMRAVCPE